MIGYTGSFYTYKYHVGSSPLPEIKCQGAVKTKQRCNVMTQTGSHSPLNRRVHSYLAYKSAIDSYKINSKKTVRFANTVTVFYIEPGSVVQNKPRLNLVGKIRRKMKSFFGCI